MSNTGVAERRHLALTLLVAGTFFMENLDGTILATAAPSMARFFRVDSAAIAVTITAYFLTLAVLIPVSGWLTVRFGARVVFPAAIVVFTIASLLCALSTTLAALVVFRVIQGIGGAMMVPVGRLVVLRVTEKRDLISTIAWLTWPALVAPILAPLAGGLITTYFSWQWIFIINIPLGVFAFIAALALVPRGDTELPRPLDWGGLLLTCVGLGALTGFTSELANPSPAVPFMILLGVIGVGCTGLAIRHLLRVQHPLLELRALRIATFRISHVGGSVFRMTINAVPFLLPLMFQDALGLTPVASGALVLFVFVGNLAIKPLTTPLMRRFGFRHVLLAASFGAAASMALVLLIGGSTPFVLVAAILLFGGVMRSTGFTVYNTLAFADIPQPDMTAANTLSSTIQQLATGFGVALGAVLLAAGQALDASRSSLLAFHLAFAALAVITLFATAEALFLDRHAADALR